MNVIDYFNKAIDEYDNICNGLCEAVDEDSLEKAINNVIDYIFKYPNTQNFENVAKVTIILENIVNFCSSKKYSYEGLIKYKEDLLKVLDEFRCNIIESNSIRVVFQNDYLKNKYEKYIHQKYLNDFGRITVFLHDYEWKTDNSAYSIECNIEEHVNNAINTSISQNMKRETLHLMSNLNKIKNKDYKIKNFITGSSYSLYGLNNSMLKEDTLNASMLAQDLYLSSKIIKMAVNNNDIENCILTIAPYNFHLDISSIPTDFYKELFGKVYYANLKDKHNSKDDLNKYDLKGNIYAIPLEIRDIFNEQFSEYILEKALYDISDYKDYFNEFYTRELRIKENANILGKQMSLEEKIKHIEDVSNTHNKFFRYKNVENENKLILRDLMNFLDKNNVKLTLVIFPMPELYRELVGTSYEKLFYSYIKELSFDFDFSFIDLYADNRFDYSDFGDGHHLNIDGAKKATSIIKEKIDI